MNTQKARAVPVLSKLIRITLAVVLGILPVSPAFGLSLKDVVIPDPTNLHAFLRGNPQGTLAEQAEAAEAKATAIALGKALFWDMQTGSDDVQACASCHFNAGADLRHSNQLNPGPDSIFGNSGIAGVPGPNDAPWSFGLGPNSDLSFGMFPFHFRSNPLEPVDALDEFANVIRDTNDAGSSMGVRASDAPWPAVDPLFNWLDANQRRVEPRNAPSMINAVVHVDMFWDGRASFVFNGANPFGFRDREAAVQRNVGTDVAPDIQDVQVRIPFAAHASQSVGPPLSDFEMSGHARDFAEVGQKMLDPAVRALGLQVVHPNDSVLGPYAKASFVQGGAGEITGVPGMRDPVTGEDLGYLDLIQEAFRDEWWNGGAAQQHANFSLFFGLSMQVYQGSLIADETPWDRFAGTDADVRGDGLPIPAEPGALTEQELLGLDIFQGTNLSGLNPTDPPNPDPLVGGVDGLCINCHILPETSNHNLDLAGANPLNVIGGPTDLVNVVVPNAIIEAMPMGIFVPPATFPPVITDPNDPLLAGFGLYDVGFYNIGVRPTAEDLGRFGKAPATASFPDGLPFSYVELADMKRNGLLAGAPDVAQFVPDIPNPFPQVEVPLADGTIVLVDIPTDALMPVTQGAFKVPTLRNQQYQGPYFHNGGDATLRHVVEFYARGANFPQTNIAHLDPEIGPIPGMADDGLTDPAVIERNIEALVAFLANGLTDPRVANGEAPFDHPQLFIPGGTNPAMPGEDRITEIKAVGAEGGHTAGHFLGLDPQTASSLEDPGRIRGRVTLEGSGAGVAGIEVSAHRLNGPSWIQWSIDYTDGGGYYDLAGLSPGSYRIRFADELGGHQAEIYNDVPYYDITTAGVQEVPIAAGQIVTGIDASIAAVEVDVYEADDTMQTARLARGDAVQSRTVLLGGNEDWIRIEGRAGTTYALETSGIVPVDTVIELWNADGQWVTQNDNGGAGTFSLLSYTAPADGDLFFKVRGATVSVAGPYTLTISAVDVTAPSAVSDVTPTYTDSASVKITAEDDWSGLASITYTLDGAGPVTVPVDPAAHVSSIDVATDVLGPHTMSYYATDLAGHSGQTVAEEFYVQAPAIKVYTGIAGDDRYDTAVAASQEAYPDGLDPAGARTVVIATGLNWPDALGGASLAGVLDGPILLVQTEAVPASVAAEITRLDAEKAIILGGKAAVGSGAESALMSLLGSANVSRIDGDDRYQTADAVANEVIDLMGVAFDGTALVATGANFPDALAAAPLAAGKSWPIYLAHPTGGLSVGTRAAMTGVDNAIVLGGDQVVSADVEDYLEATYGSGSVTRLAGADRYETAVAVATYGVTDAGLNWDKIAVATGEGFADALAGGVVQGKDRSVLVLTASRSLHPSVAMTLGANKTLIRELRYLGGPVAVSFSVRTQIAQALK